MPPLASDRRRFLRHIGAAGLASALPRLPAAPDGPKGLIAAIEKVTLRRGRDGSGPTWFHPRACVLPHPAGPRILLTLQTILGSDVFGPVHAMGSPDAGRTWTDPEPVPALGRVTRPDGNEEGVCDVVPEYHAPTGTVLALGHNVFYRDGRFLRLQPSRWPVYSVWRNGRWGPRRRLEWNDPRGAYIYSNNCGQRVTLPDGDILLAFSYRAHAPGTPGVGPERARAVATVVCGFDGETLRVKHVGREIAPRDNRSIVEPSLTRHRGRFYLTLRTDHEDHCGYVTTSEDGLNWAPKQKWAWDDGEPLVTSQTQQHWLTHSDGLFLVYTRRDPANAQVIRWRSPLYLAEVDPRTLRLRRTTERIVLPLVGDGVNDPDRVALMGNFHPVNVTPAESWVTVGEWQPRNRIRGDLLLGRIRWSVPNRLATTG